MGNKISIASSRANHPADTAEDQRQRMVCHFDNATPHATRDTIDFMNCIRLMRPLHPPFSSNLASSAFSLFGKLKMALVGQYSTLNKTFSTMQWKHSMQSLEKNFNPV
jgi:hypothetical protein